MTDFARKVLAGLPDSNVAGTTNNYMTLQEFTADSNKGGGKVDFQFSPAASMFARYGMRNLTTDDQPNIPLPSGGAGNGLIYARNRQLVLGTTWTPSGQSLLEARFGYSWTQAGKNPPALGSDSAPISSACRAADRPAHRRRAPDPGHHRLLGSRTPGDQSAVAVPDRLQPEDQLHLVDRRAFAQDRLRVPAHPHRSAGRQPALRPRHLQRIVQPAGRHCGEQPL